MKFVPKCKVILAFFIMCLSYLLSASPIKKSFKVDGRTFSRKVSLEVIKFDDKLSTQTEDPYITKDSKGNVTYLEKPETNEQIWISYDENGKEVSYKIAKNGLINFEYTNSYDDKGQLVSYVDTDGISKSYEYDDKGNLIHSIEGKDGDTVKEEWYQYNDNSQETMYRNSEGFKRETAYTDFGKVLMYEDSEGIKRKNQYNTLNKLCHSEESKDDVVCKEASYEYDPSGMLLTSVEKEGDNSITKKYDFHGNVLVETDQEGHVVTSQYKYYDNGDVQHVLRSNGEEYVMNTNNDYIYFHDANGTEKFMEYEYNKDGSQKLIKLYTTVG